MNTEQLLEIKDKYYELLFAVVCKFPGESRHETALRYITERENTEVAGQSTNAQEEKQA